jgi:hypothetical protein
MGHEDAAAPGVLAVTVAIKATPLRGIGVTPGRLYLMMATSASSIWSFQAPR